MFDLFLNLKNIIIMNIIKFLYHYKLFCFGLFRLLFFETLSIIGKLKKHKRKRFNLFQGLLHPVWTDQNTLSFYYSQ